MKRNNARGLLTGTLGFFCLVVVIGVFYQNKPSPTKEVVASSQDQRVKVRTGQTEDVLSGLLASKTMHPNPEKVTKNLLSTSPSTIKTTFIIKNQPENDTKSNSSTKGLINTSLTVKSKPKLINKSSTSTASSQNLVRISSSFHEIYYVPKGYCALTFDDGPSIYTEKIASYLKSQHLPATFFFIGQNVKHYPKSVAYANRLGFKIGDHSYSHPQLTKLSESNQAYQILTTKKQIERIIGKPVTYFRPPYGSFNSETKDVLVKNKMTMVLWNCDPRDWATKSPQTIVQRIKNSNLNGKVIILHDQKQTWEALPQIIKTIKAKGLKVKGI